MRQKLLLIAGMLCAALILSGCVQQGATQVSTSGCGVVTGDSTDLTPEQNTNAKAIAAVAISLGLGEKGAMIGITAALTESGLKAVNYGDMTGPGGSMSSSRGLFQMKDAWGSLEDRLDPTKSAMLFFTVDKGPGVRGLIHIPGWETMTVQQAAQAVEGSQFSDGSNYANQISLATKATASIVTSTTCASGGVTGVTVNGPNVTIPDNPNVIAELRGIVIKAPNDGVAKGLAAGFAQLGKPYVWGGSDANGGEADNGSRGGGDYNSGGSEIGFDCSGLTGYVIVKGGFPGPGTNSGAQRSGGQSIPYDQILPGDIIGFPGHVAMSLGVINGKIAILEASWVGTPIHIVWLTRSDKDSMAHRYWNSTSSV